VHKAFILFLSFNMLRMYVMPLLKVVPVNCKEPVCIVLYCKFRCKGQIAWLGSIFCGPWKCVVLPCPTATSPLTSTGDYYKKGVWGINWHRTSRVLSVHTGIN